MKKLIVLMIVFAGALTSCKKAYTCECETKTGANMTPITNTYTYTDTKSNATTQCENFGESMNAGYSQAGGYQHCQIK